MIAKVLKILSKVEGLSASEFDQIREGLIALDSNYISIKNRCKHLQELNQLLFNGSKEFEYVGTNNKTVVNDKGLLVTYNNEEV